MSNALPYISAIVALAAALIAIAGKPKWDSSKRGLHRLTRPGQLTVVLATVAFFSTALLTWNAQQDAREQQNQRGRIKSVAHAELRHAICLMLRPLYIAAKERSGAGKSECDLIRSDVDMLDAKIKAHLETTDLNAVSPFEQVTEYNLRWGRAIQVAAESGYSEVDRVKQIYAAYLDSDILVLLSELRRSEFLKTLRELDLIVTAYRGQMANSLPKTIDPLSPRMIITGIELREMSIPSSIQERAGDKPEEGRNDQPFPFDAKYTKGYKEFWDLVEDLDNGLNTTTYSHTRVKP